MRRRMVVLAFWVLLWQMIAVMVDNPILLVTPLGALRSLMEKMMELSFWRSLLISTGHIAGGFFLGLTAALILAALSYRYRWVADFVEPLIHMMKTVPVVSFVVLLLIWWGSSALAVAICFLVVVPGIYSNTLEGLISTDKGLLEMAEVFQLKGWNRFLYIYRPALYPFVKSGLKLALGMCWKSGVAAEVIGMSADSIGEGLYLSKIYLDTGGVFAWTVVIVLLSVAFEKLIFAMTELFFAWVPGRLCKEEPGQQEQTSEAAENKENAGIGRISCLAVAKSYGENKVYENLSVCYSPGSITYLKGVSGSGKTTLLRMISGLEKQSGGTIECEGRVSMLFQEDRLCEDYSAVCNVAMITGNPKKARVALEKLLDKEALDKPCRELSGGMKRRVALVRAMEADSDIVLLDEPFTGLDAENKTRAENYIAQSRKGRTLLIASHI